MFRSMMLAAAAAFALAACNQGTGTQLPPVQEGAQAPSQQTPSGNVQQAQVTDDIRQQLIANIGDQLNQIQANFAAGMAPPNGMTDTIVPMQPSTDHRFDIALNAGAEYRILGACDGDCTNVDIELIDRATGGVVASDMLPDDYPVVTYTPAANGNYIVRILMQTCSVAPCYAGARVTTASAGATTGK